jgi:hypothetical protein
MSSDSPLSSDLKVYQGSQTSHSKLTYKLLLSKPPRASSLWHSVSRRFGLGTSLLEVVSDDEHNRVNIYFTISKVKLLVSTTLGTP